MRNLPTRSASVRGVGTWHPTFVSSQPHPLVGDALDDSAPDMFSDCSGPFSEQGGWQPPGHRHHYPRQGVRLKRLARLRKMCQFRRDCRRFRAGPCGTVLPEVVRVIAAACPDDERNRDRRVTVPREVRRTGLPAELLFRLFGLGCHAPQEPIGQRPLGSVCPRVCGNLVRRSLLAHWVCPVGTGHGGRVAVDAQ